ncbi:hypothetical protein K440DRAFT_627484 [Wilcoxina mikolae CBS 423.85]|nr:hypothetical protein K440DRAFT_627484 [Wilcoxina mikolae CBS 423.85]
MFRRRWWGLGTHILSLRLPSAAFPKLKCVTAAQHRTGKSSPISQGAPRGSRSEATSPRHLIIMFVRCRIQSEESSEHIRTNSRANGHADIPAEQKDCEEI